MEEAVHIPPLKTNGLVEKFEFKDPEQTRNKLYKIECKLVGQAKLRRLFSHLTKLEHMPKTCQTICQGLEVMFNYERTQRFVTAPGNRFFSPDLKLFGPNFDVGRGKEGVSGFAMSLRLCQGWNGAGVVLLNIDILHVVFYRPLPVLDYLKTLPNGRKLFKNPTKPLSPEAIRVIEEKIKNKVQVVIMNTQQKNQRKYLVDRVSSVGPEMHTFEVERGNPASQRSVAKHFLDTHGITLKYPKLNCFVMTKGGAYVPIEVCQIAPKQLVQEKLSGTENKEVIKQTAVKPQDRQEKIKKIFKENKFDEDPALRLLGVSIEDDVSARCQVNSLAAH
ncbi:Argonaute linker 1 domain [Trinorchestia longiramus]|nr:Argonaute linker 1 domain [Trinorchestia longiramus]